MEEKIVTVRTDTTSDVLCENSNTLVIIGDEITHLSHTAFVNTISQVIDSEYAEDTISLDCVNNNSDSNSCIEKRWLTAKELAELKLQTFSNDVRSGIDLKTLEIDIVQIIKMYLSKSIISKEDVNIYGKYFGDNSRDSVSIAALKTISDKENTYNHRSSIFLTKNMEKLATKYNKSPNENIPSPVKLPTVLYKKISKLDERNQGEKKVIDAILSIPEFSKVESNKKKHVEYHYRFENDGELIEGDISLTKLKQIISLCLQ